MNDKIELFLSQKALEEIGQHAQEAFPEECCGVILTDGAVDQVHRLKNIQNQLHALDPQTYPRTATIAYAMDYKELELVLTTLKGMAPDLKLSITPIPITTLTFRRRTRPSPAHSANPRFQERRKSSSRFTIEPSRKCAPSPGPTRKRISLKSL